MNTSILGVTLRGSKRDYEMEVPVVVSPVNASDGLARVRAVGGVGRLERVTSGRRPGDVRAVVVAGNELAAVVPPSQRLELLRRDVGVHGRSRRAVPEDDEAARVADQDLFGLPRMDQKSLDGSRIDLEVFRRVLHHDVLVDDVLVDGEAAEVEDVDVAALGAEEDLLVDAIVAEDRDLLQSTLKPNFFLLLEKDF